MIINTATDSAPDYSQPCDSCNAEPNEPCRPGCLALAAWMLDNHLANYLANEEEHESEECDEDVWR